MLKNLLLRNIWPTMKEHKKVTGVIVAVILTLIISMYSWYQMKKTWNWKVGGYQKRAQVLVNHNVCKLGKEGAFRKEFNWEKYCD